MFRFLVVSWHYKTLKILNFLDISVLSKSFSRLHRVLRGEYFFSWINPLNPHYLVFKICRTIVYPSMPMPIWEIISLYYFALQLIASNYFRCEYLVSYRLLSVSAGRWQPGKISLSLSLFRPRICQLDGLAGSVHVACPEASSWCHLESWFCHAKKKKAHICQASFLCPQKKMLFWS